MLYVSTVPAERSQSHTRAEQSACSALPLAAYSVALSMLEHHMRPPNLPRPTTAGLALAMCSPFVRRPPLPSLRPSPRAAPKVRDQLATLQACSGRRGPQFMHRHQVISKDAFYFRPCRLPKPCLRSLALLASETVRPRLGHQVFIDVHPGRERFAGRALLVTELALRLA